MRFYNVVFILLTAVVIEVSCECGREFDFDEEFHHFPWSVLFTRRTGSRYRINYCSGTLINPSVVISAASCFYNETSIIIADSFIAFALGAPRDGLSQMVEVKSIHIANGYQGSRGFYAKNIALLTLQHPFNITSTIRPICIDFDNQHESEELQVGRIGKIEAERDNINVISRNECVSAIAEEFRSYLTTDEFCGRRSPGISDRRVSEGVGIYFHRDGRWYLRGLINRALSDRFDSPVLIFTNVGPFVDGMKRYIKGKTCGKVTSPITPTIRGGLQAEVGEFPWHVAIYRKDSTGYYDQICAGSLISSNVVVSAAHCFYDDNRRQKMDATIFAVAAGKHNRLYNWPETNMQTSPVETIHISRNYYGMAGFFAADIAWLILESPFHVTSFVTPICLHWNYQYETAQFQIGQIGTVAGWGLTADGSGSSMLKKMNVLYFNHRDCIFSVPEHSRPYVTVDKFCASFLNGTQLCQGDSGGGLVFERHGYWYLRGIVSANAGGGTACDINSLTAFTDVGLFTDEFTNILANDFT